MCKAGTRKNATGRSTSKTEHNRTLCEIERKSGSNFERKNFRIFRRILAIPGGLFLEEHENSTKNFYKKSVKFANYQSEILRKNFLRNSKSYRYTPGDKNFTARKKWLNQEPLFFISAIASLTLMPFCLTLK